MAKKKVSEVERKMQFFHPPQIDHSFQKVVSYSQYSIWAQCPHRWNLTYIQKKQPYQASIHTVFGTAFHETLQSYFKTMYEVSGKASDGMDLKELLRENFSKVYSEEYGKVKSHFTTPQEMGEFYDDGVAILDWIQKRRNKLFTIRKVKLLGIEIPLIQQLRNNVFFQAYIDVVLYDEELDKIYIYDIKTSTRGWNDNDKRDDAKVAQILLYKQYFANQFNVDVEKIEVEFFIVKRKIWEESEFPIPRVQSFKPPSGKIKRKQAVDGFQSFLDDCFDGSGKHQIKSYIKNVGEKSCKWCPFNDKPELCDKNAGLKPLSKGRPTKNVF